MIRDTAGNVWAKTGGRYGGWSEEFGGGMTLVATGGGAQIILDTGSNCLGHDRCRLWRVRRGVRRALQKARLVGRLGAANGS